MKSATILLALLVAALGAALVLRGKKAQKALTEADAANQSMSNQVAELKTKITAQTLATVTWQENHSNRVFELAGLSNRLTRTATALDNARTENQRSLTEIQSLHEKVKSLETHLEQVEGEQRAANTALENVRSELVAARKETRAATEQRDLLTRDLNQARAEKDELTRTLSTIPSVEAQLIRLKTEHKTAQARREAELRGLPVSPKDKSAVLELQADGSVKLVRSSETNPATR